MPSNDQNSSMPYKIDTHAHFLPPFYRAACFATGHGNPDGMPALPEWTPEAHLALMENLEIRKSILSISSPGTHLTPGDDASAASLARECNSYASALKRAHPMRFGYFASLPLPAVDACLAEIRTALDDEDADGFVLESNAHGLYPGDPALAPVFDELNRRSALVFIHPTTPHCPCAPTAAPGTTPQPAAPLAHAYPNPMLEFFFDTARCITHLLLTGTLTANTNIRWIFPHLAGAFPPLLSRATTFSTLVLGPWTSVSEDSARAVLADRVWVDLAGMPFPGQIRGCLAAGWGAKKILYGSDFPFTKSEGVAMLAKAMDEGVREVWGKEEVEGVYHGNAEALLGLDGS